MKTHRQATATSAFILILVFVSGALVGGAFVSGGSAAPAQAAESPEQGVEGEARRERRPPMYEQVGITDAQRVTIDSIMVDARNAHRGMQREHREAYEAEYRVLIESVRESIQGVMNEEQRTEYQALLQASDDRRAARRAERQTEEGSGREE